MQHLYTEKYKASLYKDPYKMERDPYKIRDPYKMERHCVHALEDLILIQQYYPIYPKIQCNLKISTNFSFHMFQTDPKVHMELPVSLNSQSNPGKRTKFENLFHNYYKYSIIKQYGTSIRTDIQVNGIEPEVQK